MNQIFPHIQPDPAQWPVAEQSRDRAGFIERLNNFVFDNITKDHDNIYDLISKTAYMENQRIKINPWKVDPTDEKVYWKNISTELESTLQQENPKNAQQALLKKIINRYNEEIVGHFSPKTFKFARKFLTIFFKRLFCRYFAPGKWRFGKKSDLQDKIKIKGNVELMRTLFEKGTVVILPTHYSNLDSIMVGYAIDTNVGLPHFSYGAGLNLYNVEIVAYFINRLGAFRVDRRKKNPVYLECLKSVTGYSVIEGVNCLFFPGGTRSRSGQTEDKLKLGLISSVIEAQRLHLQRGDDKKIYVVPLNIGYHFVLEASHLIDQYLQSVGRDKYKRTRSAGPTFKTIMRFIKDIYTKESEVYMSFGDPMDVFGNRVDENGNSFDKFGNQVYARDYFSFEGELSPNTQRESVYAKLLGENVIQSYKKFNVILSSNVLAFTAFHLIFQEYKDIDFMQMINQTDKVFIIEYDFLLENTSKIIQHILKMQDNQEVTISDENWQNPAELLSDGFNKLGIYHAYPVLKLNSQNQVECRDLKLLFFYHNRLVNYGLEALMGWSTYQF